MEIMNNFVTFMVNPPLQETPYTLALQDGYACSLILKIPLKSMLTT